MTQTRRQLYEANRSVRNRQMVITPCASKQCHSTADQTDATTLWFHASELDSIFARVEIYLLTGCSASSLLTQAWPAADCVCSGFNNIIGSRVYYAAVLVVLL